MAQNSDVDKVGGRLGNCLSNREHQSKQLLAEKEDYQEVLRLFSSPLDFGHCCLYVTGCLYQFHQKAVSL